MITLKQGVVIDHRTDGRLFRAAHNIDVICESNYCIKETVVTSGNDGTHMNGSKHYMGEAFDFRVHHWPMGLKDKIYQDIKAQLGKEFDCLLEAVGTPNEHLHVEIH